jgi:tRNA A37 threonylcarbamoyladenosine synthetase subunit TsaC/SUA5/YrdC
VPSAEVPLAIVRAFGSPITATSANLHGAAECTNARDVRDQLGDCLPLIVDGGDSPRDMPSTIVDLTGENGAWRLLRHGAIPAEQIVELLGQE